MAQAKKKILSVREAFDTQCVQVEVVKPYGKMQRGDQLKMHKNTAAPLINKKLVKKV